jgi:aspartate/methionine/tyrosine aminotransferase
MLADVCKKHDLWLLSDEVYWTLGGGEHISPRSLPGMAERTLVINSMSKSHGMTGWRIGWLTGPADIIGLLISLNLVSTYGLTDFVSRAAIEAHDRPALQSPRGHHRRRRLRLLGRLSSGQARLDRCRAAGAQAS